MRYALFVVAALLLTASSCTASHSSDGTTTSSARTTLRSLAEGPGSQVALVPGASDFAPGKIRYPFLVVDRNGASIERPRARVWLARGFDKPPFERRLARRELVGIRGGVKADSSRLYVAHLKVPGPGKYWVLAKPVGGVAIQGIGNLVVRERSLSPPIVSRAYPSETPTLKSAHGKGSLVTTRQPPDIGLLKFSIASSLAAHKPFVVAFATPKFCSSRTCGPVVDVVDTVRKRFAGNGIRFLHVEIYNKNDPTKGLNRWVREWRLPTEPWVFVVGPDGRIKAKFEGSVSIRELSLAVRRFLVRH